MSVPDLDLEFDLGELVGVFGEPLDLSRPELRDYWFRYERADAISVTLSLDGYERSVAIIIRTGSVACSSIRIASCDAVRVMEADRRTLEVISTTPTSVRCFLALEGDTILDVASPGPG